MRTLKKLALALIVLTSIQCVKAQHAEWKELDAFHEVMGKTFHPSEKGNLKPLREHSAELVSAVKALKSSPIPKGYKPAETKEVLNNLATKCETINKAVVAKKSDEDLKKLIFEAHELFHEVAEKCQNPETEK